MADVNVKSLSVPKSFRNGRIYASTAAGFTSTSTSVGGVGVYLPLSGGNLTGDLGINEGKNLIFTAPTTAANDSGDIIFQNSSENEMDRLYSGGSTANTLMYRKNAGTGYGLFHEGNSNITTVDWYSRYNCSTRAVLSDSGENGNALVLLQGGGLNAHGASAVNYPISAYENYGWNFTVQHISEGKFRVKSADRSTTYLSVRYGGYVGINKDTPTVALDVVGDIVATGNVSAYSDERVKTNIKPLHNVLDALKDVTGCEYDRVEHDKSHEIGLIAQELEKVYPELVHEHDGMKSVDYMKFTAVLLQAIKELNVKIEQKWQ